MLLPAPALGFGDRRLIVCSDSGICQTVNLHQIFVVFFFYILGERPPDLGKAVSVFNVDETVL